MSSMRCSSLHGKIILMKLMKQSFFIQILLLFQEERDLFVYLFSDAPWGSVLYFEKGLCYVRWNKEAPKDISNISPVLYI
jgi:hypothetical protein